MWLFFQDWASKRGLLLQDRSTAQLHRADLSGGSHQGRRGQEENHGEGVNLKATFTLFPGLSLILPNNIVIQNLPKFFFWSAQSRDFWLICSHVSGHPQLRLTYCTFIHFRCALPTVARARRRWSTTASTLSSWVQSTRRRNKWETIDEGFIDKMWYTSRIKDKVEKNCIITGNQYFMDRQCTYVKL